jgi:drug/metabolite transporter (DMT)-like permease
MKLRDALQLVLLSAIWGASFLLIRIAVGSFPPAWVALLRLVFGAGFSLDSVAREAAQAAARPADRRAAAGGFVQQRGSLYSLSPRRAHRCRPASRPC